MAYDDVAASAIADASRYGVELDAAVELLKALGRQGVNRENVASAVGDLISRLETMEAAVRAASRLTGTAGRYGNGNEITDGRKRDRETLAAALRLLEGEGDGAV